MIATLDVADVGRRALIQAMRRRPAPGDVPGLRWLDVAPAAALASVRPPGLRRAVLLGMWDDEASAATFAGTHSLARRFAGNGFHAVLRPLRAFGSWPGLPADVPRSRVTQYDGPVIVTTLGRLRLSQAVRFLRASRPAERAALDADGFLWGTAAARPPFMATVSAWSSDEAAAAYAYADATAGHPRAIARQRQKDFHRESAFIRYAVVSSTGSLPGAPPIEFTPDVPT
ncbi:MAG: spheroidene monooxygenase [Actinobacteria bacterium]|nr:spheroidene monooxygenase [Actinomycetota bacterium]